MWDSTWARLGAEIVAEEESKERPRAKFRHTENVAGKSDTPPLAFTDSHPAEKSIRGVAWRIASNVSISATVSSGFANPFLSSLSNVGNGRILDRHTTLAHTPYQ